MSQQDATRLSPIDSKDTSIIFALITLWYLKNVLFSINIQILHAIHVLYRHPFSVASWSLINCYKIYVHSEVVKQCCPDTLKTRILQLSQLTVWTQTMLNPGLIQISVSRLAVCVKGCLVVRAGVTWRKPSLRTDPTLYPVLVTPPTVSFMHALVVLQCTAKIATSHSLANSTCRSPRRAVESVKCVQYFRTQLHYVVGMCLSN